MPIDFYFTPHSPPCQTVSMVAAALGLELNEITINPKNGDHLTPEFIKMNPQHTIPTIKDGDFVLWESRAIISYLVNKYGKENDSLYPKDPLKRALVDQRLYFDLGTLNQRFSDYFYPQYKEQKPADPEKFKKIEEAIEFLNILIKDTKYAAGDVMTIADITLFTNVSILVDGGFNFSLEKYPNVQRWFMEMKANVPGYAKFEQGLAICRDIIKNMGLGKEELKA